MAFPCSRVPHAGLSLLWLPETRGIEIWGERITRIGVVENIDDRLLGLSTEEELLRFGIRGWQARSDGGWWRLSISAEEIRGENFVPGATSWRWRIAIEA